jgi:hypothetical protein
MSTNDCASTETPKNALDFSALDCIAVAARLQQKTLATHEICEDRAENLMERTRRFVDRRRKSAAAQ